MILRGISVPRIFFLPYNRDKLKEENRWKKPLGFTRGNPVK